MEKNTENNVKFAEKLPLEKFIPATFLIFLVSFIVLSIITYNNISLYKQSVSLVDHTNRVLAKTDQINLILSNIQLQRRAYIVKGESRFLNKYKKLQDSLKTEISDLNSIISDNPDQLKNVNNIDSLSSLSNLLLDSSINIFSIENKITVEQTNLAMQSQEILDDISKITANIKFIERDLLEQRQANSKVNLTNTQIFIIVTSLFAFAVLGLSLYIFNKLIKNKNEADKLLKSSYDELEDKVESRTMDLKTLNENLLHEIENRIKIENSLRESEERFRVMADSAPALIWIAGTDKRCTYFNKGWLDFTGRTMEQELGNGWIEGVHHEDLERCLSTYSLAFDNQERFEMEYRLKNAEGDYRWILDRGIPRYSAGEFKGYIGLCFDIHEKKRTDRYLKIQYTVTRSLTESLSTEEALKRVLQDICTGVNWKFGIAWVAEENLLKQKAYWSETKPISTENNSVFDMDYSLRKGEGLPGLVWETGRSLWIENIEAEPGMLRKADLKKLGWRSAFAVPVKDSDRIIAVIECFNENQLSPKNDLMEVLEATGSQVGNFLVRKKAEEELKLAYDELENRVNERTVELANTLNRLLDEMAIKEKVQNRIKIYGHALRGIRECVYITNLQNKTIFVNPAFESVYGYFENELIDKYIPVLYSENINEEHRKEILSEALKNGWKGELVNKRKDGKEFNVYLSASVIRNENGQVDAIVGIVQDITQEKNNLKLLEKRYSLLSLINDVAVETNRFDTNEKSIQYAIDKVCEYTGWEMGHYMLFDGEKYKSSGIWNSDLKPEYDVFRAETENTILDAEEGFRKKIIEDKKPVWIDINTLNDPERFPRAEISRSIGLNTFIWSPVLLNEKVNGIIEFFNRNKIEEDEELLNTLQNISGEISNIIQKNSFVNEIKEREKHFSAIADTANDAIITANSKGNIVYVNTSTLDIFGYTREEIINSRLEILMPGKYKEAHKASFEHTVNTGESHIIGQTIELSGRKKDGTEFPIEISIAKWEMNNEIYFTGMIRDITFRKSIEKELIENRNSLLEAQSIAKMGNWSWDVYENSVKWSDEMYKIYEISEKDFDNSFEGFLLKLHPEDREEIKNKITEAYINKHSFEFSERIITPEGKVKILRSIGGVKLDENNNVIKMVGTCLDITDIEEAERKVRENEERLTLIMENIRDYAIITLDTGGNIMSWNKAAEKIKGYSREEIIGKNFTIFYTEADIQKNTPFKNLELARKHGQHEDEGWRKKKDGALFWADIIFTPLYDRGKLKGYVKVTRDVTERRNAEESIRLSEQRLRDAQKMAKLGSWEWNADEDNVNWSDEMYNIFEIEKDRVITYERYLKLLDDENKELRKNIINEAVENNRPFQYFIKYKAPSGKHKILSSQGEIEKNKDGSIKRMVGTVMDVTTIKEAEEKIRESEGILRNIQQIAKLGSWKFDVKKDEVTWSDEMYQIFEIPKNGKKIKGDFFRKYAVDEDQNKLDIIAKNAIIEKKPYGYEYRILTPDKKLKYLKAQGEVYVDQAGEPDIILGTVYDITDIKEAQKKIEQSEKQLKEAQAIAKLGSWEVNIKSGEILWSDEMYRIHEIEPGHPLDYQDIRKYVYPDDQHKMDSAIKKLENQFLDFELDYRIITPNGRLKYLNVDLRVDFDKKKKPLRLYGSVQDITDIKLVEEELRKTNAKLIEAQKELIHNEKLAALGRFSSGIAHEIRNPLANISALAQLLSKSRIEDEKMKKHLKYILVNSDIANNIIKDLLNFASPEDLVFNNISIKEMLENTIESMDARAADKKIAFVSQISQELPELYADKVKLENALLNFLSNAIDAIEFGGNITVKAGEDKINKQIIIDIIDTGKGIPMENLDKIFEPFFTTKETGTGLGLGLAYQYIKSHNGTLNIQSQPGQGTHVQIKLPVRKIMLTAGKN